MSELSPGKERFLQAREDARKRSNYTCQSCGKKDDNLQGHHWAPKRDYPSDDEVTPDDLTALCPLCHAAISRIRELLAIDKNRDEIQKAFENSKGNLDGLRIWIRDANTKVDGSAMDNMNKDKHSPSKERADLSDMLWVLTESISTEIQTNARQTVRIEELERTIKELETKLKNWARAFWFLVAILVIVVAAGAYLVYLQ